MNRFWRIAPWLTRLMLVPPTLIFALIASRYLFDPVHTGATIGLAFNSPLAITITRVGFGAFPLACSIFTLSCLVSTHRNLIGLGFVALIMTVALIVRVFGMLTDGTVQQSMGLVRAEALIDSTVAVGTTITDRPPHRSVRARLRIRLLRGMSGVEAGIGIGVQNAGWRNPPVQDWGKTFPTHLRTLATTDQNTLP